MDVRGAFTDRRDELEHRRRLLRVHLADRRARRGGEYPLRGAEPEIDRVHDEKFFLNAEGKRASDTEAVLRGDA